MEISRLYQHYLTARKERIVLSFMGVVTQEIIVDYGKILREQEGLTENSRHVLFATFIELAQNILRYSAERSSPAGRDRGIGLVIVSESPDAFVVTSGNMIKKDQSAALAAQLDGLARLDRAALKELHRERRRAGAPADSQGAGLGLIELARRASTPLEHSLLPQPNDMVFFSISVSVAKT